MRELITDEAKQESHQTWVDLKGKKDKLQIKLTALVAQKWHLESTQERDAAKRILDLTDEDDNDTQEQKQRYEAALKQTQQGPKKMEELMAKRTAGGSDDGTQPEQQSDNPADDSNWQSGWWFQLFEIVPCTEKIDR